VSHVTDDEGESYVTLAERSEIDLFLKDGGLKPSGSRVPFPPLLECILVLLGAFRLLASERVRLFRLRSSTEVGLFHFWNSILY